MMRIYNVHRTPPPNSPPQMGKATSKKIKNSKRKLLICKRGEIKKGPEDEENAQLLREVGDGVGALWAWGSSMVRVVGFSGSFAQKVWSLAPDARAWTRLNMRREPKPDLPTEGIRAVTTSRK